MDNLTIFVLLLLSTAALFSNVLSLYLFNKSTRQNRARLLVGIVNATIDLHFDILETGETELQTTRSGRVLLEWRNDHYSDLAGSISQLKHKKDIPENEIAEIENKYLIVSRLMSPTETISNNPIEDTLSYSDPNEIMKDYLTSFLQYSDKNKIDIKVNMEPAKLEIPRSSMKTALNALVSNAIKYSYQEKLGDGSNRPIEIVGQRKGDFYEIAIFNYGTEIKPKELDYIFDKFDRGATRFSKKQPGLGFGLAFVKQIVEGYNGTITVSRNEEGHAHRTSFDIKIPIAKSETKLEP